MAPSAHAKKDSFRKLFKIHWPEVMGETTNSQFLKLEVATGSVL